MRVALGFPVYRTIDFGVLEGVLDLWTSCMSPAPETAEEARTIEGRLHALDVVVMPIAVRGYGGGRSAHHLIKAAAKLGCSHLLSVDADMRFATNHVVQILEGYNHIRGVLQTEVAVGAVYPRSSQSEAHILHPLYTEEEEARGIIKDRLIASVEGWHDQPFQGKRYVEVATLGFGFTLWPVEELAAADDLAEVVTPTRQDYFDKLASQFLRDRGVRLFSDLSLDVGHGTSDTLSSYQRLKASP